MADKVQIELEVLAKKALDSVTAFAKDAQKTLDGISTSTTITGIKAGFDLGREAVGKFTEVVGEWIKQSVEAEEAQRKLNNAMRLTGEFTDEAVVQANKFAESLSKVSAASDNQVISALALAKSYGLSNGEARRLVAVSADLAAFLGEDLNSAVQSLSETYGGHVRALQKMFPELEGLSKKQLAFGAAVDAVAKRVKGSALDELETYRGQTIQLRKEIEKAEESLGNFVTRGLGFWIRKIREAKEATVEFAKEAKDTFIRDNLNAEAYAARYGTIFDQVKKKYKELGAAQVEADREAAATRAAEQKRILDAAREKAKEEQSQVKQIILDSLPDRLKIEREAEEKIALVRRQIRFGLLSQEKGNSLIAQLLEKETGDVTRLEAGFARRIVQLREGLDTEVKGKLNEIAGKPLSGVIELAIKGQEELDKAKAKIDATVSEIVNDNRLPEAMRKKAQELGEKAKSGLEEAFSKDTIGIQFATTLIASVKKGAAGAADAVADVAGGVATAIAGPVVGGLVKELTSFLAQGPEAVRKQITEFARAIPQVIQNIAEAAPEIMQAFEEQIPFIVEKFLEGLPRVIEKLAESGPKLFATMVANVPKLITAFVNGFVRNIPQIIKAFADGLLQGAKDFINALVEAVKGAFSGLLGGNGLFGGGNGGGGIISNSGIPIISDIGNFLGLADGGRIPDLPQYEGDRFPARLNAGEQVLSKDLSSKLDAFLAGAGGGGAPQVVKIQIGQRELAQVLLDLSRNGFRTA